MDSAEQTGVDYTEEDFVNVYAEERYKTPIQVFAIMASVSWAGAVMWIGYYLGAPKRYCPMVTILKVFSAALPTFWYSFVEDNLSKYTLSKTVKANPSNVSSSACFRFVCWLRWGIHKGVDIYLQVTRSVEELVA
jgi:hypothetical protein